jgi:hypothetical protein
VVPYNLNGFPLEKEAPMKEFISAVEDIEAEDEREAKIVALVAEGKTREEAESEVDEERYVEFKVDGREMRAYQPTDGQLAFMLAALGRGQTSDQRFAAIVNIMLSSLRDSDRDYMESRLLTRDRKHRLPMKQLEAIFEHLTEEWFARPTQ